MPYGYSKNNPINYTDPLGLEYKPTREDVSRALKRAYPPGTEEYEILISARWYKPLSYIRVPFLFVLAYKRYIENELFFNNGVPYKEHDKDVITLKNLNKLGSHSLQSVLEAARTFSEPPSISLPLPD